MELPIIKWNSNSDFCFLNKLKSAWQNWILIPNLRFSLIYYLSVAKMSCPQQFRFAIFFTLSFSFCDLQALLVPPMLLTVGIFKIIRIKKNSLSRCYIFIILMRVRIRGQEMFVFQIWLALFSCYLRFKICPSALSPTNSPFAPINMHFLHQ